MVLKIIFFIFLLMVSGPVVVLLKNIGEKIGNGFAFLIVYIHYVPTLIRQACILYLFVWFYYNYDFPSWAVPLFIISTIVVGIIFFVVGLPMNPFNQNKSKFHFFESNILLCLFHLIVLHQSYLYALSLPYDYMFQLLITLLVGSMPLYFIRSIFRGYSAGISIRIQKNRNRKARAILAVSTKGRVFENFGLFLRGFDTDNKLRYSKVPPIKDWINDGGRFNGTNDNIKYYMDYLMVDDIENILFKAYQPQGKLIAAGHPLESFGVGKVTLEESSWEKNVTALMKASHKIFIVPIDTDGTLWEMHQIIKLGLLPKTIFIMPSHVSRGNGTQIFFNANSYLDYWIAVQEILKSQLSLPDFKETGAIFMITDTHEIVLKNVDWNQANAYEPMRILLDELQQEYEHLQKLKN